MSESFELRLMTIPEAEHVVYEAADDILSLPIIDEERHLVAEHLGILFDKVASIRSDSKLLPLQEVPMVNYDHLLVDFNVEKRLRYNELRAKNNGSHPRIADIPPELGALITIISHTEAVFNSLDRSTN